MRWSNVPIPQPHVAALIGAAGLHAVLPLRLPIRRGSGKVIGGMTFAAGIGLAAWAVASAGEADVETDETLITDGAFELSRNPMYVGWSAGVLGLALWTRSAWLLGAWAVAIRALDREIDREEARLLDRFGATYGAYRARVPRYVGRPRLTVSLD
jgi:protein-S-isoprenylcysteine O-methyltransferase Ste14